MTKTIVVTICGSMLFTDDMMKAAQHYESMDCVVLVRFIKPYNHTPDVEESLERLQIRKIEMADIIHVVHSEAMDRYTMDEIDLARSLGKAITYAVPSKDYINTFKILHDNVIRAPLHWVETHEGYYLADTQGERVYVLAEEIIGAR